MNSSSSVQAQVTPVDVTSFKPEPLQNDHRELVKAVHAINSSASADLLGENTRLKFRIDSTSRRPVIEVVDKDSESVLFQIPTENVLELAKSSRTSDQDAAAYFRPSGSGDQA